MPTQPSHYPIAVVAKQLGVTRQMIEKRLADKSLTRYQFPGSRLMFVVNDQKLRTQRRNAHRKVIP